MRHFPGQRRRGRHNGANRHDLILKDLSDTVLVSWRDSNWPSCHMAIWREHLMALSAIAHVGSRAAAMNILKMELGRRSADSCHRLNPFGVGLDPALSRQ